MFQCLLTSEDKNFEIHRSSRALIISAEVFGNPKTTGVERRVCKTNRFIKK